MRTPRNLSKGQRNVRKLPLPVVDDVDEALVTSFNTSTAVCTPSFLLSPSLKLPRVDMGFFFFFATLLQENSQNYTFFSWAIGIHVAKPNREPHPSVANLHATQLWPSLSRCVTTTTYRLLVLFKTGAHLERSRAFQWQPNSILRLLARSLEDSRSRWHCRDGLNGTMAQAIESKLLKILPRLNQSWKRLQGGSKVFEDNLTPL